MDHGLRIYGPNGGLKFATMGRYVRIHSLIPHYVGPGSRRSYSFNVTIPGAKGDGTWTLMACGQANGINVTGTFTDNLLTVNVYCQFSTLGWNYELWVLVG